MPKSVIPGPFEAGLRALLVLEALHPASASTTELSLYDHVVVHTADFGGPASLHPAHAGRAGEVLIRDGLALMQGLGLVDRLETEGGMRYQASDDAPSFLDALSAGYTRSILDLAEWVATRHKDITQAEAETLVAELKGRPIAHWEPIPDGEDPDSRRAQVARFRELDADYLCDLGRLSAIAEAACLACAMAMGRERDGEASAAGLCPSTESLADIEGRAEAEALGIRRDRAGLAGLIRELEQAGPG